MNPTSTVCVREKFRSDELKSIEKAAKKAGLSLTKVWQTDTNLFGKVYDLKIRHQ